MKNKRNIIAIFLLIQGQKNTSGNHIFDYFCNIKITRFMTKFQLFYLILLIGFTSLSCKKEKPEPITETATSKNVTVSINHFWGDENTPLSLNHEYTHPETGEDFTFQACNYYLSNFQLRKNDGTWWSHPHAYHLIRVTDSHNYEFELTDVPFGEYDALRFLIGVDSAKNVSGAQAGDLAPSNAMFWSWSTGYIMIKLEGNSSFANWEFFSFHIGGFRDLDNTNVTRWKEFNFEENKLDVKSSTSSKMTLNVDVSKTWNTNNSITEFSSLHSAGDLGHTMADQFSTGITLKSIE